MTALLSSTRPWVAYVGPVVFPEGGAAARRILGNAQALVAAGRDVVVVSGQSGAQDVIQKIGPGITCVSVNERNAEHLPKAIRYARYALMGGRSRAWLAVQTNPPEAVILYSGYTPYLLQLTRWARRRRIPLIFDAVEWYTAPTLLGFIKSPYLWNIELAMRVLIPRTAGVIAISRALESYYEKRDVPVLRVPPLLDTSITSVATDLGGMPGQLRLAYCGSPGRKDLLDMVVKAVVAVNAGQQRIQLDVAGLTESEFLQLPTMAEHSRASVPIFVKVHGRVPHHRSMEIVRAADFTVFLREINRVSNFGFPTKFVESLALGTPVITNLTSDLGDFFQAGNVGLLCHSPNSDSLQQALVQALTMSPAEHCRMRAGARNEAERVFDCYSYARAFSDFLSALNSKKIKPM